MTYRSLAVAPLVLVAFTLGLALAVPDAIRDAVVQGEVDASKGLAFVGLAAAALAFDRGDYLRRGWGVLAANYVFILARDAVLLLGGGMTPQVVEGTRGVLVTVGNVLGVVGTWTLARAWAAAGLEYPGSRGARRAVLAVAVLVALALAGPMLVVDLRALARGTLTSLDLIPSDLGDMLCLPLVAPVALTALAVRDGTLRWPWTLLTSSLLAWLLYDAIYTLPDYLSIAPASFRFYSEQFHVLAGALACAAGLAQRKAVTDEDA